MEDPNSLLKKDLISLATLTGAPSTGTKKDLIVAIEKAKQEETRASTATTTKKQKTKDGDDDGWTRTLKARSEIDLDKVTLSWASPSIILMPKLWAVMFWRHRVPAIDIYGQYGTEGRLLELMMSRWRRLLPSATETDLDLLAKDFGLIWTLVEGFKPVLRGHEDFAKRHWSTLPSTSRTIALLQIEKLKAAGQHKIANRVAAHLAAPVTEYGAEVGLIVKTSLNRVGTATDTADFPDSSSQGKWKKGQCR